jgi:E3 ubiquitin-protein ligase CBL
MDRKILQTIPQSLVQALIDGQKQGLYIYPDGKDIKIDISSAIAVTSASRVQISQEQYDMYCDIGTSFQLCKICSENNKDRKLEPCGHLICSSCLETWQEVTPSCPFCRCEIKAFEPIFISPFEDKVVASEIKEKVSSSESINSNSNACAVSVASSIIKPNESRQNSEEVSLI